MPSLNSHFGAASVVQVHTQSNAIPAQSNGGHSRKNSIDVNATRPIIQHRAPTPQILIEDSPREVPRREAFPPVTANMPQPKSLPPEPISSATMIPQVAPAPQTTITRDVPDIEILPEPRSARLLNLTSANVTSTLTSSQQPTIGSGSSKSRALLDEVRLNSLFYLLLLQKQTMALPDADTADRICRHRMHSLTRSRIHLFREMRQKIQCSSAISFVMSLHKHLQWWRHPFHIRRE